MGDCHVSLSRDRASPLISMCARCLLHDPAMCTCSACLVKTHADLCAKSLLPKPVMCTCSESRQIIVSSIPPAMSSPFPTCWFVNATHCTRHCHMLLSRLSQASTALPALCTTYRLPHDTQSTAKAGVPPAIVPAVCSFHPGCCARSSGAGCLQFTFLWQHCIVLYHQPTYVTLSCSAHYS